MGKKKKTDLEDPEPETSPGPVLDEGGGENPVPEEGKRKHRHKDKSKEKGRKKKRNLNDGVTRVAIISSSKEKTSYDSGVINFSEMGVENDYSEETSLTGQNMSHAQRHSRRIRNIIVSIILILAVIGIIVAGVLLSYPATYSCSIKNGNYYVVKVDAPQVSQAYPPLICAGEEMLIYINGSHFITKGDSHPRLTLTYDNTQGQSPETQEEATVLGTAGCEDVGVRRRSVKECDTLMIRKSFPSDASGVVDATYDVYATVAHPKAPKPKVGNKKVGLECEGNTTKILTVIPVPTESEIYPPFACVDEETEFKVSGHFFLDMTPARTPSLEVCGARISEGVSLSQCVAVSGVPGYESVDACSELTFSTAATACGDAQKSAVPITNPEPAPCTTPSSSTITIAVARKPTIKAASPSIVCAAQGGVSISLTGADFVTLDGALPKVSLDGGDYAYATSASDCTEATSGNHVVKLCGGVTVDVPETVRKGTSDAESATVEMQSPLGTCGSATKYNITVLPVPVFSRMVNETVCASTSGIRVRAAGSFVTQHGTPFAVAVGSGAEFSTEGTELYECTQSVVNGIVFDRCTELEFPVPSGTSLGEHPVTIRGLCYAHMDSAFAILPKPTVTSVDIKEICLVEATPLVVTGSNFLVYQGRAPDAIFTTKGTESSYTVAGEDVTASECTDVSDTYSLCNKLSFTVPANILETGVTEMVLRNGPADGRNCAGQAESVTIVPKPSVTAITSDICENQDAEVAITGANFVSGISAPIFFNTETGTEYPASDYITAIVYNSIKIAVPANYLPAGKYTVRIENSPIGGCQTTSSSSTGTLTVHANTLAVLAAEPPIIITNTSVATILTIYTRNFAEVPDYIELKSTDGKKTFRFEAESIEYDDDDYTRLRVTLPAEATTKAAGTVYSAVALGKTTCLTTGESILKVAPSNSFTVTSVSPKTISIATENADTTNKTSVTITTAEGTFSSDAFPEVFLVGPFNSVGRSNAADTTKPVKDVFYISDSQLRLNIATDDLEEGTYDLYISFEATDGTTAGSVLAEAFSVSSIVKVPTITDATHTVYHGTVSTVEVDGTNFGASGDYEAVLRCKVSESNPITTDNITVENSTHMRLGFKISSSLKPSVCTLEIKDTKHGFTLSFPGISIVSSSRKISSWETSDLPTAVCASAAAAYDFGLSDINYGCCSSGLCSNRSFIYLIGGDEDKACQGVAPSTNVFAGAANAYGVPTSEDDWVSTAHLPAGLMHASAEVVGPYIYVVGGLSNDNSVQNTVLRAHILQPKEAPVLTGAQWITTETEVTTSITPGAYYYAVAAVYSDSDSYNPGGMSLPSNVFSVRVATKYSRIELSWDTVEDAVSYNVYRTPTPGLPPTQMAFLASVDASTQSYVDTGSDTPDEKRIPATLGSIGKWATLSETLNSPRYGHATAVTQSLNAAYMFAMGGFSDTGGTQAPYYETITLTTIKATTTHGRTKHTLEAWTLGTRTEFSSRSFWRASVLDSTNFDFKDYISTIVLGGSNTNNYDYVSNYVQNNPHFILDPPKETTTSVSSFGYCQFVLDDVLYNIGGTNNTDSFTPLASSSSSHFMVLK